MKILLAKKRNKGLFIFINGKEVQYVVAELFDEDLNKAIGSDIECWQSGAYFGYNTESLKKAIKCLVEQ